MQPHDVSPPPESALATTTRFEALARRHRRQKRPALLLGMAMAALGFGQLWPAAGSGASGKAEWADLASLTALSAQWLALDRTAAAQVPPCNAPMELCPPPPASLVAPGLRSPSAQLDRLLHELAWRRSDAALLQALLGATLLLGVGAGVLAWQARGRLIAAGLAAEASARSMSMRDPLTQLLNRRALDFFLPRMLRAADRAGRPIAVLAIALDGVQAVAAEHGADAGDELLRVSAYRIHAHVREIDVVAHLGGSPTGGPAEQGGGRFIVVLEAPESAAAAQAVCERVRAALAEPLRISRSRTPGAPRVAVAARIGLAVYPIDAPTAERLLQRATEALRRAGPSAEARAHEAEALQRLRSACESITTGTRPTSTMASEGRAASARRSSRAKL